MRRLCKVAFSHRDASLYLFPYAAHGKYYYGGRSFAENQLQDSFNFTNGFSAESIPKLSIHESGQVHVVAARQRVDPLQIPRLDTLTGQHVATACPDAIEALPLFGHPLGLGPALDIVISASELTDNARIALYINGSEPVFDCGPSRAIISMTRSTLTTPLYVCIRAVRQARLVPGLEGGITCVAGWNPLTPEDGPFDYLYIRGA